MEELEIHLHQGYECRVYYIYIIGNASPKMCKAPVANRRRFNIPGSLQRLQTYSSTGTSVLRADKGNLHAATD
jgi:hypothetical protein